MMSILLFILVVLQINYLDAFQATKPRPLLSPIPNEKFTRVKSPTITSRASYYHSTSYQPNLRSSSEDNNSESDNARSVDASTENCWNSNIRKMFTALSGVGMVETGYLTYLNTFDPSGISKICGGGGLSSCSSVLNSPYATVQINDETTIPLTALGFFAYSTVAILSIIPLLNQPPTSNVNHDELDINNRIAILCATTSMATFSSFLLSILFNTLHQSCPYCLLSAALSLTMGFTAWFSGMLPSTNKENGFKLGVGSFVGTTIASLILFFGVDEAAMIAYRNDVMSSSGFTNNVVASAAKEDALKNVPPPPITSSSSPRALKIGEDMKELNTRFFGAYWCSHCYDQKQRMGREAMANVQYIECSPEGLNSQTSICKERGVPGYPTWEIGGNLYPGEMYLDELEDIIAKIKSETNEL